MQKERQKNNFDTPAILAVRAMVISGTSSALFADVTASISEDGNNSAGDIADIPDRKEGDTYTAQSNGESDKYVQYAVALASYNQDRTTPSYVWYIKGSANAWTN